MVERPVIFRFELLMFFFNVRIDQIPNTVGVYFTEPSKSREYSSYALKLIKICGLSSRSATKDGAVSGRLERMTDSY